MATLTLTEEQENDFKTSMLLQIARQASRQALSHTEELSKAKAQGLVNLTSEHKEKAIALLEALECAVLNVKSLLT